jgi:hypothetical protein
MLMTSVSASTAQIELTFSGSCEVLRQRADLLHRHAQVARDVLQELARARRALAGHLVAQHLAALVDADGAAVERADVDHRAGLGVEEDAAAGVRGHRVEVAGGELDVLAFAGGGDVVDVAGAQAGVGQHAVVALAGQRHGVAAADALAALGQPFRAARPRAAEQHGLDGARADVDADGECHVVPRVVQRRAAQAAPHPHGGWRGLGRGSCLPSTTARQAKVAPPSAPV